MHHQTGREEEVEDMEDSIIKKQQEVEHSFEHPKRKRIDKRIIDGHPGSGRLTHIHIVESMMIPTVR